MYFNKIHNPVNFRFPRSFAARSGAWHIGRERFVVQQEDYGPGIQRLRVAGDRWPIHHSHATFERVDDDTEAGGSLAVEKNGHISIRIGGEEVLRSFSEGAFGVCGQAWLFRFAIPRADFQCYGMGCKNVPFDRSRLMTKYWNTDIWADFDFGPIVEGATDPMYCNIPWVIFKHGDRYHGFLVNNPDAVFMNTGAPNWVAQQNETSVAPSIWFGAPAGVPDVFWIVGPDLATLTRRLQRLVGTTPVPPLWALGHHQCRWGYGSRRDLEELDEQFEQHDIPTAGLWLDIDYMDGYRVFTFNRRYWRHPQRDLAAIRQRGRRVVAILDPGVKREPGYFAYDECRRKKLLCRNPEGEHYVGFVWPGATVFPDFSLAQTRRWWRDHSRRMAELGLDGAWLDMNDPAVGSTENQDMLFNHGRYDHGTFHNQYAVAMAAATRAGFQDARPDERPFLLTRSGWIGIQRHAAVWTGDNFSNWHHLRQSIPISLNLALSGVPFNGPDVPGFGGDADAKLATAWYRAGFLFPFLRNHSNKGTRDQEPWRFGKRATSIIRHYLQLRQKLVPYLYQCFCRQHSHGEAILRPLIHDFRDTQRLPLHRIDDQFLIGPAIMQAPQILENQRHRYVALPAGWWFDARHGTWQRGGRRLKVDVDQRDTPLWFRDGSLVPMRSGMSGESETDLSDIELHVFLRSGRCETVYHADDGHSLRYAQGGSTSVRFRAQLRQGKWTVESEILSNGWRDVTVRLVLYGQSGPVSFNGTQVPLRKHRWRCTGGALTCWRTDGITVTA